METILDSAQVETGPVTYAGFWIRFVAYIIDSIVIGVVQSLITFSFFSTLILTEPMNAEGQLLPPSFFNYLLVLLGINWLYFAFMESSKKQATLGKMALNLKVTSLTGERISFLNATGRYFSKFVSTIILLIGYIMAGFDPKKQALHDKMASTYVVMAV
jgi:uncharacterized RDD family membrane protein YckC